MGSRIWDALLANEEWRDEAPKLSGMLLELPPSELMEVLGSEEQFAGRVNEALSVLQQSRDSGAGAVSCAEPGGATTSPGPTGDDQGPALGLRSVCWWWVRRGSCQKGDACSKVHDDDLRTQFRSLAKNVCFHYKVLGTCNRGSRCRFSHCDTAAPVNSELSQSAVPNPSLSHDSSQPNQTSPVEHKSSLPSSTFLHSGNLSASSAGQLVSESGQEPLQGGQCMGSSVVGCCERAVSLQTRAMENSTFNNRDARSHSPLNPTYKSVCVSGIHPSMRGRTLCYASSSGSSSQVFLQMLIRRSLCENAQRRGHSQPKRLLLCPSKLSVSSPYSLAILQRLQRVDDPLLDPPRPQRIGDWHTCAMPRA